MKKMSLTFVVLSYTPAKGTNCTLWMSVGEPDDDGVMT